MVLDQLVGQKITVVFKGSMSRLFVSPCRWAADVTIKGSFNLPQKFGNSLLTEPRFRLSYLNKPPRSYSYDYSDSRSPSHDRRRRSGAPRWQTPTMNEGNGPIFGAVDFCVGWHCHVPWPLTKIVSSMIHGSRYECGRVGQVIIDAVCRTIVQHGSECSDAVDSCEG